MTGTGSAIPTTSPDIPKVSPSGGVWAGRLAAIGPGRRTPPSPADRGIPRARDGLFQPDHGPLRSSRNPPGDETKSPARLAVRGGTIELEGLRLRCFRDDQGGRTVERLEAIRVCLWRRNLPSPSGGSRPAADRDQLPRPPASDDGGPSLAGGRRLLRHPPPAQGDDPLPKGNPLWRVEQVNSRHADDQAAERAAPIAEQGGEVDGQPGPQHHRALIERPMRRDLDPRHEPVHLATESGVVEGELPDRLPRPSLQLGNRWKQPAGVQPIVLKTRIEFLGGERDRTPVFPVPTRSTGSRSPLLFNGRATRLRPFPGSSGTARPGWRSPGRG